SRPPIGVESGRTRSSTLWTPTATATACYHARRLRSATRYRPWSSSCNRRTRSPESTISIHQIRRQSEQHDQSERVSGADEGDHAREGAWDRELAGLH
ncbi:hypothetical protein PHJA_001572000, partial [Phtheirospermum japonicum]